MSTNESRPTATIIQFSHHRRQKAVPSLYGHGATGNLTDVAWPTVECGSGWYHEAAMREAVPARRS